MEKLKIGLLYISLHNQLVKKVGINRSMSRKDFFCIIGKHFLIPKNIRIVIIEEMKERGLIKEESNKDITVLQGDINLEEDSNKIYKMAGLF